LPKCLVCGSEVLVSPTDKYVYVNINIGVPGKENPIYFHIKCFEKTVKKRSKLERKIDNAIIEAIAYSF